jgi:hypothetical protein
MAQKPISSNPLIERLTKKAGNGFAGISGFSSTSEKGDLRIYRDLTLNEYIDLPHDAILEVVESNAPECPSSFFINGNGTVTYTREVRASGRISQRRILTLPMEDAQRIVAQAKRQMPVRSGCSCAGEEKHDLARQTVQGQQGSQGPVIDICTWRCVENFQVCWARNDGLSAFWCVFNYVFCYLDCGGPVIV